MWDLGIIKRMNKARSTAPDEYPEAAIQYIKDNTPLKEQLYGHPKFHAMLAEIGELHDKKNFDYAEGGQQGPLGNFKRIAAIASLYPTTDAWSNPTGVALTYMLKQLDAALMMFTTGKHSKTGENLKERLRDVAIYALLAIILNEEAQ